MIIKGNKVIILNLMRGKNKHLYQEKFNSIIKGAKPT